MWVGLWWKLSARELVLLNCGVGEDSWESPGLQGDQTNQSWRKSVLNIHWKDWCWSWNSNTLATWCEELTHWKKPWCWERLKVGGEGDDRGWDGWMASLTQWKWVWVSSGSWWCTGKPGVLQSMGSQSQTRLSNWTELNLNLTDPLLLEIQAISIFFSNSAETNTLLHPVFSACSAHAVVWDSAHWGGTFRPTGRARTSFLPTGLVSHCFHLARVPEKHPLLLYWLCQRVCVDHNKFLKRWE